METRLWLLFLPAGLPEPEPGFTVRDAVGGWIGEVDLAYAPYRIAIEYHGDVHRTTRRRWQSDVAKVEHQKWFTDRAWRERLLVARRSDRI